MEQSTRIETVCTVLDNRARAARGTAWALVGLIIATVSFLVFVFFLYARGPIISFEGKEPATPRAQESEAADLAKMRLELDLAKARLASEQQQSFGTIAAVSSAVTRIGAVMVGLYLVQILFGLTRYHFRLADHLSICSRALTLADDDLSSFGPVMTVMATTHIDFGKAPTTPIDKVLDVLKEAVGRVR